MNSESDIRSAEEIVTIQNGTHQFPKRKRLVLGDVALLACLACRQARAKCDGKPPSICGRCQIRGLDCVYAVHSKMQKEDLTRELNQAKAWSEHLIAQNRNLESLVKSIAKEDHDEEIFRRLRANEELTSIVAWLDSLPHRDDTNGPNSDAVLELERDVHDLAVRLGTGGPLSINARTKQWTAVTSNHEFVDQLVLLFIRNVLKSCALLDKQRFLEDYLRGQEDACSTLLLNTICCMACGFVAGNLPERSEQDIATIDLLQSSFRQQARESMNTADKQSLTTMQAMVVIFMIDLADGQTQSASAYLDCAEESLCNLEMQGKLTEELISIRLSIRSLCWEWSMITLSLRPSRGLNDLMRFGDSLQDTRSSPCRGQQDSAAHSPSWTSGTVVSCQARLCMLGLSVLKMYYGLDGAINWMMITTLHDQLMNSSTALSTVIKRIDTTENSDHDNNSANNHWLLLRILCHTIVDTLWCPVLHHARKYRDSMRLECQKRLLENARRAFGVIQLLSGNVDGLALLPHNLYWIVKICNTLVRHSPSPDEQRNSIRYCLNILSTTRSSRKLSRIMAASFLAEVAEFVDIRIVEEAKSDFDLTDSGSVQATVGGMAHSTSKTPFAFMSKWLHPELHLQWPGPWINIYAVAKSRHSIKIHDICD